MPFITAAVTTSKRDNAGRFVSQRATPAVVAGVRAFAMLGHQESQANVRVKTGRLKASGTESPFPQDPPGGVIMTVTDREVRADITYTAPYASYVEFRFPFLRPALDTARSAGMALFRDTVRGELK